MENENTETVETVEQPEEVKENKAVEETPAVEEKPEEKSADEIIALWKGYSRKHESEKKEALEKITSLQEELSSHAEAIKTLAEKETRIAELENQIAEAARASVITNVISEFNLNESAKKLLTGQTEEEIREQASALAEIAGARQEATRGFIPTQGDASRYNPDSNSKFSEVTAVRSFLSGVRN